MLIIKGVMWLAKKINEVAEIEFSGRDSIKENLMELQLRYELDLISEEEYIAQESELLERLNIGANDDDEDEEDEE